VLSGVSWQGRQREAAGTQSKAVDAIRVHLKGRSNQ
jgi:hypothetical protein